ncbi:EAL domain-containing protein [Bradyrhizobium pachyrhizi]|uniref:EAL domain-containing protein n=1 Tax=Bradyrhizobium pachyrhizi TaxID=280333 RepID=A0A844SR33_9BRAD|nr:EAL domain-containing protein [Bradyrhizobium pachyrhizi]MVT69448.1 EAL domain-containing protein [Bradyrhizobium pachyrhizi]
MSLSNPRSRVLRADWFDWRSSATRDFIALFGGVVLASILAHVYELGPRLFQLGRGYADSALDAIVFMMFVAFFLSVALTIFSVRRYRDLARETKARTIAEAEARDLARHDPLTGLPNRRLFDEKLDACLGLAGDTHQVAVLMLGLRGFKRIKDAHGHAAGDKALCEFANRLADVLRTDGVLARIGGDEFGIVMPDITSLEDPTNLARRIVASAGGTFAIETGSAELGVGIGIAIAPIDGVNLNELVRGAERALYRAQGDGRSCVRFFEPEMDMHVERRIEIERELRSAITADIIEPHYQPFVSLKSNCIIGFEALARWENRTFGHIPPDLFIPIAEETGLINALGNQLLRRACFDANTWPEMFTLAFNISPIQLRDPALGQRILSILGQTGFSPSRLEIEITESAFVEKTGVAKTVMDELRQAGVRIALDDFGTGYATLSQLLSFRLDKIKIDRSFVSHLDDSTDSQVIVRAILGIANGFGLTATAEGVEDAGQLAYLVANGCAEGQGSLFSDAVPAAGIPALLSREPGRTAVEEMRQDVKS